MKTKIENQIKDLQNAWANGSTGMSVSEYNTTIALLEKKLFYYTYCK